MLLRGIYCAFRSFEIHFSPCEHRQILLSPKNYPFSPFFLPPFPFFSAPSFFIFFPQPLFLPNILVFCIIYIPDILLFQTLAHFINSVLNLSTAHACYILLLILLQENNCCLIKSFNFEAY